MTIQYLAGFFDGEGCVSCSRGQWEVVCVQTEKNGVQGLMAMAERWGGSMSCAKPARTTHSPCWRWKTRGIEALIALHDMLPYLVVKKEKAEEAIAYLMRSPKHRRIMSRLL